MLRIILMLENRRCICRPTVYVSGREAETAYSHKDKVKEQPNNSLQISEKQIQKCRDNLFSAGANGKRSNSQVAYQEKLHKELGATLNRLPTDDVDILGYFQDLTRQTNG